MKLVVVCVVYINNVKKLINYILDQTVNKSATPPSMWFVFILSADCNRPMNSKYLGAWQKAGRPSRCSCRYSSTLVGVIGLQYNWGVLI